MSRDDGGRGRAARGLAVAVVVVVVPVALVVLLTVTESWGLILGGPTLTAHSRTTGLHRLVYGAELLCVVGWLAAGGAVLAVAFETRSALRIGAAGGVALAGLSLMGSGVVQALPLAHWSAEQATLGGMAPLAHPIWTMYVASGVFDLLVGALFVSVAAAATLWTSFGGRWSRVGWASVPLAVVLWGGTLLAALGSIWARSEFHRVAWGARFVWTPDEVGFLLVTTATLLGGAALVAGLSGVAWSRRGA